MRLFAAIPLPRPAHDAAVAQLAAFRDLNWSVRWVKDDGLHLTLKFFGEVTPDRLETISEMLGFCVAGMHPMSLAIVGGGVFPHPTKPRVLFLSVSTTPELELLQDRIERGGERIGFPPEGRPFNPHLTMGRVREGLRLPLGAIDRILGIAPQPPFSADRLVLFESEIGATGPKYVSRAEFPFK
jgi:2'-5' RNA ligase